MLENAGRGSKKPRLMKKRGFKGIAPGGSRCAADGALSAADAGEGGDAGGHVAVIRTAVVADDGGDVAGGEFFQRRHGRCHVGGVLGSGADKSAVDDSELVAGDEQAVDPEVEAEVAGGVAGGVDYFEAAVDGQEFAVFEDPRHRNGRAGGERLGRQGLLFRRQGGYPDGDFIGGEFVVGEGAFDVGFLFTVGANVDHVAAGTEDVGEGAGVVPVLMGDDDAPDMPEGDAGRLNDPPEFGEHTGKAGVDEGSAGFVPDEGRVDGDRGAEDIGDDGESLKMHCHDDGGAGPAFTSCNLLR